MAVLGLDHVLDVSGSVADPVVVGGASRGQRLLRQGLLGAVVVLATAVSTAALAGMSLGSGSIVVTGVLMWLAYSCVALPAYERAVSWTPVTRFAGVVGALALASVVTGVADRPGVRGAAVVLVAAASAAALSVGAHRVALRRTPTVLVGATAEVDRLARRWSDRRDVAVVDTYGWSGTLNLGEHRSDVVADVLASVRRHRATTVVVVADGALSSPALRHLAWALQRAQVECLVVADMNDHAEALRPRRVGDQVALSLRASGDHLASSLTRTAIDRVGAALGLLVLSPLLVAIAIAIKMDSRGPVVFSQIRSGRDGVPFRMYKFRSMVTDAESRLGDLLDRNEAAGPLFKIADDPRITRLGRLLRSTSLDELLQLVNVLKGDMSLVGPRPALPSETVAYDPWTWRRLHVRPGLTGLWQVSGRSTLTWEEAVRKDLEYVNHQSLRLDLSILVRTVGAVVRREGAH